MSQDEFEIISSEFTTLLEAIQLKYGYDFKDYSEASFRRRISNAVSKHRCKSIGDLLRRTLDEPDFFALLLSDLTVTVTEMFRDPLVFKMIREQVVPYLKTYPEIKIWFAGCAGGEEVYSMAILLKEEGLYGRSILYGTDINPAALRRAKAGVFDVRQVSEAGERYVEAGGKTSLSSYFSVGAGAAIDESLKRRILFSDHNLVSDGVFGEMQMVFCRNALIYFSRKLQERAIGLFKDSLCPGGFFCLGSKESLFLSNHAVEFDEFGKAERIYRKKRRALS